MPDESWTRLAPHRPRGGRLPDRGTSPLTSVVSGRASASSVEGVAERAVDGEVSNDCCCQSHQLAACINTSPSGVTPRSCVSDDGAYASQWAAGPVRTKTTVPAMSLAPGAARARVGGEEVPNGPRWVSGPRPVRSGDFNSGPPGCGARYVAVERHDSAPDERRVQ